MNNHILEIRNLSIKFPLDNKTFQYAVDNISFSIKERETVALVGESGCGKSITAYSILGLLPPSGEISNGEILFKGADLRKKTEAEIQDIRGNKISMIFQEPMTALNPVLKVGFQISEGLVKHKKVSKKNAKAEAIKLIEQVGIPSPEERYHAYPHQLSGGMKQRIIIAMALICEPELLIADEPTTALDVTIQAQILELIDQLKIKYNMSLLLITHDLGIVAERSQETIIMYSGQIVETGATKDILNNPYHPYTKGLLASLPQNSLPGGQLHTIPGTVSKNMGNISKCIFSDRCPEALERCFKEKQELKEKEKNRYVACWRAL